jgi:hypothetical protein
MGNISATFHLSDRVSEVTVSERHPDDEDKPHYLIETLFRGKHEVSFCLGVDGRMGDGEYPRYVNISLYHAVNADTGRGFHADIAIPLRRDDLLKMRAFIDLMLLTTES